MSGLQAAVEACGLVKHFGDLTAVNDVSFSIRPGEIYGLVGPDGAGKTTTLRMLAGIMDPDEGEAQVAGYNPQTEADLVKDQLAYMSQRFGLYPDLTVQENIEFYADLYGVAKKGRVGRMDELLDFSNMRPFKQRRAANLSGGMKQKLQLVCALIHTPKVLLLDEPTNGVDPVSRRDFWRILYDLLKQDVCILVTTAYLDEAERCNRVGLMHKGKITAQGSLEEVKQLMQGSVLTVRAKRARRIKDVLKHKQGFESVNVFGASVHVVARDENRARRIIEATLQENNLQAEDIRVEPPTLEDVFVSILQEKKTAIPTPEEGKHGIHEAAESQGRAVEVEALTRRFGSFTAVDGVSFKVGKGEIFGFLGPNGAGKSTTIRMLCGLLKPTSGKGNVAGIDITRRPEAVKKHIGYMSQKFSLYEDLRVEENINFYGRIYGLNGGRFKERKEWALETAGLTERRRSMTSVLSGGWKQRLAMACAVLHEPPIVFLDEPTSGVDPLSRRRFWDLIYAMADKGVTVFVTTHYMEEAEYCDRIALIYQGRMIALGAPSELKTSIMREAVVDVRCSEAHTLLDAVRDMDEVRDVALFGAGLHIRTADPQTVEDNVRRAAKDLGLKTERIERVLPSMEDVFVSLIEAEDRKQEQTKGAAA